MFNSISTPSSSSSSSSEGQQQTRRHSSSPLPQHHHHDEGITNITQHHDSMIMMETTLPPQIIINTHSSNSNSNSSNSTPSGDSESCNRSDGVSFTPTSEGLSPISLGLSDTVVRVPNNSHPLEDNAIITAKELLRVKIGGETHSPLSDIVEHGEGRNEMQKHHKFPFDHGFHSTNSIDLDGCSTRTIVKKPKKKTLFSVFQNTTEQADEEPVVYTFFDLEKPTKKKTKKTKKGIIGAIYKVAILTILFCALSSIVVFGISMDNSNSDQIGYFTAGSPTTVVWTSAFQMVFSLTFIFDLFGPLFLLRWYKRIVSFIEKKGLIKDNLTRQINIDGYSMALFARIFWGVLIFISSLINWVCYGLYSENRERLSGWLCLFFVISPISYLVIAYHQFKKFRKSNTIIFDLKEEKWYGEESFFRTRICCRVTTVIKLLVYTFMALVCALFIMFTVQSVSITQDEYKVPGTMYSIKPSSAQTLNMHMYCEGDSESEDAVLLDSDIGVASPYAYMKSLITLLAKKGMRACVIERAGYGFSDSGPFPRDLSNTTMNEMIALVKEASFKTPFILISHSSASFTARTVMEYHRKLLRGVILLHPSHEKQEESLLRTFVKNETVEEHYNTEVSHVNTIRMLVPIGIFRVFGLLEENEKDNWYDRYYMNGVKKYFYPSFTNSTLLKIYDSVLNSNKFTNTVWSELKSIPFNNKQIIHNRENPQTVSNSTKPLPLIILTSSYLLNGNCSQNFFPEGSSICQDFLQKQFQRSFIIQLLHQDLFNFYKNQPKLYSVSWKHIPSDYDIALHHPELILPFLQDF